MKKILTLIVPALLAGNLSIFTLQKNNKTAGDQLTWNLSMNENKNLPNNANYFDGLVAGHVFNYDFSDYATDLNSFVSKYPYFIFSSDNFINAGIYSDNETHYLNQKYSTESLINKREVFLDSINVVFKFASVQSNVYLATELGVIDNHNLGFLINYIGISDYLPTDPSYSVHINSLTFLTS